jgi:hypothetical protein
MPIALSNLALKSTKHNARHVMMQVLQVHPNLLKQAHGVPVWAKAWKVWSTQH